MLASEDSISIDFLSSVPDEILDASGPLGRVYRLQLAFERAQRDYEDVAYEVGRELGNALPPLGSSTTEMFESHSLMRAATERREQARATMLTAQAAVGGIVFLPAVQNLPTIVKRLDALNRKALKLGTEPTTLTVSEEKLSLSYKYDEESNRKGDFEHVFVILRAVTPKVEGFEFLATVVTAETGNIIKRIPAIAYGVRHNLDWNAGYDERTGREISDRFSAAGQALEAIDLSRFRSTGSVCEHCGTYRHRNETFIVYNEQTDELKQVGRNCLRDYTGLNNPEKVLKHLEQVFEFMRSVGGSRGESPQLGTQTFLVHAAAVMRAEGGYTKGLGHRAYENVRLRQIKKCDKQGRPLWVEPIEADEQVAGRILAWVREWDEMSEFAYNVKTALEGLFIEPRLVGYGGAAFVAYEKAQGRERERAATAEQAFLGTVDEKATFELTVTDIKWIEDRYSYRGASKPLILLSDPAGNVVKWFASRLPEGVEVDHTYRVTATVKRHDDDERYGKSTIITRAKFEQLTKEA